MKGFRERVHAQLAAEKSRGRNDQATSSRDSTSPDVKSSSPESSNRVFNPTFNISNTRRQPNSPPFGRKEDLPAAARYTEGPTSTKDSESLPATTPVNKSLYRSLDFDTYEIRLLRVRRDERGNPIQCSLEYASLINPPEYTALSYRWGDATFLKGCINIEDWGNINITKSLEQALRALRHLYRFNHSSGYERGILLWVDAVCINQQDFVERSQQVRQMRQIYSRAKEVICWVDYYQDEAVEYLIKNHFYGQACETTDRVPIPVCSKVELNRLEGDFNSELFSIDINRMRRMWVKNRWKIMEKFFRDEYWRRVWVIQEVAVATEIKIFCGERIIPWEDVVAVWARWAKEPESVPFEARSYLRATHLAEIRHRFQVKREPISLLNAMRWTYQAEATDPRDKIFALLGLCHDGANYVPVPNYKQPLEEIIADMSKSMMSFDRSLDLMCFKGTSSSEESKLPSWTPNWVNLWSGSTHSSTRSMTVHEAAYTDWHTTFSFNPVLYGSTTQTLKVEGILYGGITGLTSELAKPKPDGTLTLKIEPRARWISSTSSLSRAELSKALSLDPRALKVRDSIWKTLTMGLLPTALTDEDAALFFSKLWTPEGRGAVHNIALINWLDRNAGFQLKINSMRLESLRWWSQIGCHITPQPAIHVSGGTGSNNLFSQPFEVQSAQVQSEEEDKVVGMLDTFIETIEKVLGSGMCLAIVRTGYLGEGHFLSSDGEQFVLAPPATKESDHVWFVKGCSVPLVLREMVEVKDEVRIVKYKVIGGLYVCDLVRQTFEAEERWTRGEVVKELTRMSMVLNLC